MNQTFNTMIYDFSSVPMTDRHSPMYPSNLYPAGQWGGTSQHHSPYPPSTGNFSAISFTSPASNRNHTGATHHPSAPFVTTNVQAATYPTAFYSTTPPYSSVAPSTSPPQQPIYPLVSQNLPPTQPNRQPHTHAHSHSHSHSHPHQSQSHPQSHSLAHSRPRSQSHPYLPPQSSGHSPAMAHQLQASQYPTQLPFAQTISIPAQYPASPSRPFSCDMCALSFNRAHDLSRHRQTHTGEKPFLCNGGCGKSFTRRDALKRHQLVKQCGKIEEAWP